MNVWLEREKWNKEKDRGAFQRDKKDSWRNLIKGRKARVWV